MRQRERQTRTQSLRDSGTCRFESFWDLLCLTHVHLAEYYRRRRLLRGAAAHLRRAVAVEARAGGCLLAASALARVNLGAATLQLLDRPAGLRVSQEAARLARARLDYLDGLGQPPRAALVGCEPSRATRSAGRIDRTWSGRPRAAVERVCQACRRPAAVCRCRSPQATAVAYAYAGAASPPRKPPSPSRLASPPPAGAEAAAGAESGAKHGEGAAAARRLCSFFPLAGGPGRSGWQSAPQADEEEWVASDLGADGGGRGDRARSARRREAAAELLAALHNQAAAMAASAAVPDARRVAAEAGPLLAALPAAHPVSAGWARLRSLLGLPELERAAPRQPGPERRVPAAVRGGGAAGDPTGRGPAPQTLSARRRIGSLAPLPPLVGTAPTPDPLSRPAGRGGGPG